MNFYTALALPVFLLTFQAPTVYGEGKGGNTEIIKEITAAPKPKNRVSFGQGIDLIVRGLGLNIDNIRFIKEPKATDYFVYANNKASYAHSLIIAANNGIKLNRTIKPEAAMTREQFALSLLQGIQTTGQYPTNMMWLHVGDEASFSEETLSAVQTLIKFNVVSLENEKFRPKAYITPEEAAKMVENAATFIQSHKTANAEAAKPQDEVTFTSVPVNDSVNTITISRGSKPNSGYQVAITRIVFSENGEAVIYYKLTDPAPDKSYLQMITEPTAVTFVSSAYHITLEKE
ncbi:protease complex subunit PrcB family protein [Chitinophaga sp. MM2321]|uniref:protease complex subunit PrcB family protein n=1 Tax=Chitinophaga sp. MM2321 TaxID=3137178 RepID=UPI0032D5A51E